MPSPATNQTAEPPGLELPPTASNASRTRFRAKAALSVTLPCPAAPRRSNVGAPLGLAARERLLILKDTEDGGVLMYKVIPTGMLTKPQVRNLDC